MPPNILKVKPLRDYQLLLTFDNSEVRVFDMKKYIYRSNFFRQLEDKKYFNSVHVSLGSIQWQNGQDLSPDTLYLSSKPFDLDIEPIEKNSSDYLAVKETKSENNQSYSVDETKKQLGL